MYRPMRSTGAFRLRGAAVSGRSQRGAARTRSLCPQAGDEVVSARLVFPGASFPRFDRPAGPFPADTPQLNSQIPTCVFGFFGKTRSRHARCDLSVAPAAGVLPPRSDGSIRCWTGRPNRGVSSLMRPRIAEFSHGPPRVLRWNGTADSSNRRAAARKAFG